MTSPAPSSSQPSDQPSRSVAPVPLRTVEATVPPQTRERARSVISPVDEPLSPTTPRPVPSEAGAQSHAADVERAATSATVMPGSHVRNADEIQSVSPEGRPADPKVGPAGIRGIMIAMIAIVLVACAIATIWIGWYALPVAGFIIAIICVNPALWAARDRAHDREEVLKHRIDAGELIATSTDGHPKVQR